MVIIRTGLDLVHGSKRFLPSESFMGLDCYRMGYAAAAMFRCDFR